MLSLLQLRMWSWLFKGWGCGTELRWKPRMIYKGMGLRWIVVLTVLVSCCLRRDWADVYRIHGSVLVVADDTNHGTVSTYVIQLEANWFNTSATNALNFFSVIPWPCGFLVIGVCNRLFWLLITPIFHNALKISYLTTTLSSKNTITIYCYCRNSYLSPIDSNLQQSQPQKAQWMSILHTMSLSG